MKYSILLAALIATLGLTACEKTVVTPPATSSVPGPAGATGATGAMGSSGSTGASKAIRVSIQRRVRSRQARRGPWTGQAGRQARLGVDDGPPIAGRQALEKEIG